MLLSYVRLFIVFLHRNLVRYSILQQYLILSLLTLLILYLLRLWITIFLLLPITTFVTYYFTNKLTQTDNSDNKKNQKQQHHQRLWSTNYLYDFIVHASIPFIRRTTFATAEKLTTAVNTRDENEHINLEESLSPSTILSMKYSVNSNNDKAIYYLLQKECDTYIRTIIERYVNAWYYPLISTDQEFPQGLQILLNILLNRISDRLKQLNYYQLTTNLFSLQQIHMNQYLETLVSYRKLMKTNRTTTKNRTFINEFGELHIAMKNQQIYLKAIVELLFTEYLPETFLAYSSSACREFLQQIIVNCILMPVIDTMSKPQRLYDFIVLLWGKDMQKGDNKGEQNQRKSENAEEHLLLKKDAEDDEYSSTNELFQSLPLYQDDDANRLISDAVTDDNYTPTIDDARRLSTLEKIIYAVEIIAAEKVYNPISGAAFTVYVIHCETKSPFGGATIHSYAVRRRFREFLNLQKRLLNNPLTAGHAHVLRGPQNSLSLSMRNMSPELVHKRKILLDQYLKTIITNEILNCSHDVLEFFAYNSDVNVLYDSLTTNKLPVPRVDKVLFRTISGMFDKIPGKLNNLIPKKELIPKEIFQLNLSIDYTSNQPACQSKQNIRLAKQPLPLTNSLLNLLYTSLHSREAFISLESVHTTIYIVFGRFIERFLTDLVDELTSQEYVLLYLKNLRSDVLWPDNETDSSSSTQSKNGKHTAYDVCFNKIPGFFRQIIGPEHIRRIIINFLQCMSYEELNRHFVYTLLDAFIEELLPNISSKDFVLKYVQLHSSSSS
ncbi:unnamed protein product [Didymodactylos carnosus]|uniref:PX domain-containing protein n=1 Tax=Didymodactylos carnosus TaxID=1234261 RepID=A0A813PIJ5_9BILA|nr:unnamed protein product [Didymodactylos carnosus]CAF0754668.1 unnamed protein product [Didymodactylos carnosus]CAF3496720.1 unnamed protein product [Didymodactylos carnosus]CAF3534877.1 unnamed protein product [Didymodactylos carnosus]